MTDTGMIGSEVRHGARVEEDVAQTQPTEIRSEIRNGARVEEDIPKRHTPARPRSRDNVEL